MFYIENVGDYMENSASEELESKKENRQQGFQTLLSFTGTLPTDFDYKNESEEIREEKIRRYENG